MPVIANLLLFVINPTHPGSVGMCLTLTVSYYITFDILLQFDGR
jgi:hypothetical protein